MKEKISVIMPVYNTDKYVWEAIESILNQTFKDFEFIIIDDCSTDSSYNICKKYADKDSRIRLYRNKKNMWISFTRNKLISLSNTNFIASQDSDDISLKDRLKLSFEFLENSKDYAVVSWNNIIIDEEWKKIWYRKYSDNIENIILKKSPISQPSSMFRKDIFLEVWWYDNNIKYWLEDYDLWLRIYFNWYKIKNINKELIKYRIRKWQCKSNIKVVLRETINVQKNIIKKFKINTKIADKIYLYLEYILLLLPEKIIFTLFKIIEYKWKKY